MAATTNHEIELYIAMNEDGEFAVGTHDSDTATELAENYGGLCMRTVKLKITMSAPQLAKAEVTVPDDAGETVSLDAAE